MRLFLQTMGRHAAMPGGCRRLLAAGLLCWCAQTAWADDKGEFFLAVEGDQAYWVREMLQRIVDPNVREPARGDTGLIVALRDHAMAAFEVLLNTQKVDLDASANNGDTALMIAAYTGNETAVRELLQKGAAVNKPGWSALHYAATVGNGNIVKLLLDKSADANVLSPNKTTPLMMAARGGQLWVVKMLLNAGADASLRNEQGLSALDFALRNEHSDIAEVLNVALKK